MPPMMPPPGAKQFDDGIPKPKKLSEVPSYLWKRFAGFFTRLFYILHLVWQTAPAILILMALLCLLDGLLPIFGAYVSRDLLNEIQNLITASPVASDSLWENLTTVFKPVMWLLLFNFVYLFAKRLVTRIDGIVTSLAGELVSNHIRLMIIEKAKTVDQASFDRPDFYERLENANREAGVRPIGIVSATFSVISSVISTVSFIVVLATLSPVAPLVIILASVPGAIVNYYFRNRNFKYLRRHSKERRQLNYYSDIMVNKDYAKEVRILGLGDTFVAKYKEVFKRYFVGIRRLVLREGVSQIIVGLVAVLDNCALFGFVAYRVVYRDGLIGDYSLYTGALTSIAATVTTLVSSTAKIYEGTLFIDNMMVFMKEKATIVPLLTEGAQPARGGEHTLELRHVSFSYPGTGRYVLKDVNLVFKPGEHAVLVGLNGAGKTTLIKIITRLYDPTEGEVLLDGRDVREYDPEAYHKIFGIIFQDFGKYSETVAENIRFGDVEADGERDGIVEAGVRGNADGFIRALPAEYDTPLTRMFEENGIELSGGQWQKLSVARAFYKKSDILILDEPTAALDALAEQEVFRQFSELSDGKITVFVSHRLSSAVTASKIIVLENGEVVEIGTHAELMEQKGRYYTLFSVQANRYLETATDAELERYITPERPTTHEERHPELGARPPERPPME